MAQQIHGSLSSCPALPLQGCSDLFSIASVLTEIISKLKLIPTYLPFQTDPDPGMPNFSPKAETTYPMLPFLNHTPFFWNPLRSSTLS